MPVWNVDIYTKIPLHRVYIKAETAKEAEENAKQIYPSFHEQEFRAKGMNLELTKEADNGKV